MSAAPFVGSVVLAAVAFASLGATGQTPAAQGHPEQARTAGSAEITPALPGIQPQAPLPEAPAVFDPATPQVICGMKLWRVDPSIDPDFQKPVPDAAAGATIRRIVARECVPGASAVSYSFSESVVIKSVGGIGHQIPAAPGPSKKPPR